MMRSGTVGLRNKRVLQLARREASLRGRLELEKSNKASLGVFRLVPAAPPLKNRHSSLWSFDMISHPLCLTPTA